MFWVLFILHSQHEVQEQGQEIVLNEFGRGAGTSSLDGCHGPWAVGICRTSRPTQVAWKLYESVNLDQVCLLTLDSNCLNFPQNLVSTLVSQLLWSPTTHGGPCPKFPKQVYGKFPKQVYGVLQSYRSKYTQYVACGTVTVNSTRHTALQGRNQQTPTLQHKPSSSTGNTSISRRLASLASVAEPCSYASTDTWSSE